MRQIITVSFDNTIFQLEEDAYTALRQYLDRAKAGLTNNPDVTEILGDLERSISEKCLDVVKSGKNVLQAEDINRILDEMGPVVEAAPADSDRRSDSNEELRTPRKLYKQPVGAKVSGVCTGLAEYLGIDVVLVRISFVALTLVGGVGLLAYLVLEGLMPTRVPEQRRFKALKLSLLAVALIAAYLGLGIDGRSHGGVFGMGLSELLMVIPFAILMYGLPLIALTSICLIAVAAIKYLRSSDTHARH